MGDLLKFMQATVASPALRKDFFNKIKDTTLNDQHIVNWLSTSVHAINLTTTDIDELRKLLADHERINGPCAPIPLY